MEKATSGCTDAAGVRNAAAQDGGRAIYHLVKKCDQCKLDDKQPRQCFSKGHEQLIRTVRASENGTSLEYVDNGEVLARNNEGDKYYLVLKPASRVFVWDDRDQISEVPFAKLSEFGTLALAQGTTLLRSVPSKPVMGWLGKTSTQHPVEDFPMPPRVVSTRPSRPRCWSWEDLENSPADAGKDGVGESRGGATLKRKEPPPAAATAGGAAAAEKRQQREEGASQKAAKRRASRRPGAGVRVSPVGSGGRLGGVGGPGAADGSGAQATGVVPATPTPATKDEVHQLLTGKLKACDKRELELKAVIEKATAELHKNSERREAAVAESERQLLSIIAQREAQAAHYEQLAAQARAQNSYDRESLQAHKEKIQKEVGVQQDLLVTVAGAATEADAAAAAAAAATSTAAEVAAAAAVKMSHKAVPGAPDAQATAEDTARPGKGITQVHKDRRVGRARTSGAGVTESSSWSIGAQAARLAQAQSAQAQLTQAPSAQPQSVRAPAQAAIALQAPPITSPAAGAASNATASADASPPRPVLGEYKTQLEAEKARVREKLLQVEKELLQLENKETGAGSSPAATAAAADDTAEAQALLPAAPASAVVKPTASWLASRLSRGISGGMAKTSRVQAPFATAESAAAVGVADAPPVVAALAVTPSDKLPSNDSAMVADVSRAAISAAAPAPAAAPATCMSVGQRVVSPGGDGGVPAPDLVEQRVQPQAEGELTTAEVTVAGGTRREPQNPSTLVSKSAAPPAITGQQWESHPPSPTSGGELSGSQVVGAAKVTATMATNNWNASRPKNDDTMPFYLALADRFATGRR